MLAKFFKLIARGIFTTSSLFFIITKKEKMSRKSSRPFDDDLPGERYKSLQEAISKLKEWAKNRKGGFDLVVGSKQR